MYHINNINGLMQHFIYLKVGYFFFLINLPQSEKSNKVFFFKSGPAQTSVC